jgi:DNA repair protein RecO (recombination protein O)
MALYRDEAIVLRTYKLGEADRIVVLLSRDHGKVRAVAKGVRKTKSRFGGRLEPPGNVSLLLYRGRELDIITQAEALDAYRQLRADLTRMTDAMALLEAVDHVAQEREPNPELYRMLRGALHTLAGGPPSPLLVAGFYWKLLALEGVGPVLDRCVSCGAPAAEPAALDPVQGGVLCRKCCPAAGAAASLMEAPPPGRSGPAIPLSAATPPGRSGPAIPLSAATPPGRSGPWKTGPEAVELVRRILGGELGSALAEPPSAATAEASALAVGWMEHHLERRLRAVRTLHA